MRPVSRSCGKHSSGHLLLAHTVVVHQYLPCASAQQLEAGVPSNEAAAGHGRLAHERAHLQGRRVSYMLCIQALDVLASQLSQSGRPL